MEEKKLKLYYIYAQNNIHYVQSIKFATADTLTLFVTGQRFCQLLWTTEVWEWTECSVRPSGTGFTQGGHGKWTNTVFLLLSSWVSRVHLPTSYTLGPLCCVCLFLCVRSVLFASSSLQKMKMMTLQIRPRDTSSRRVRLCFMISSFLKDVKQQMFRMLRFFFPASDNAKESLALMPLSKVRERLMLRAMNRYGTSADGCAQAWLSLPHSSRVFYLHAYCSRSD